MSAIAAPPPPAALRRFDNAAQWLRALGGVPLERIIFDPWPGTATEADLLRLVERDKRLCELLDGTLVEKPMGYWESFIAMRLGRHLANYAEPLGLGGVSGPDGTLRMKSGRVRLPDVSFIAAARMPTTPEPIPSLAPDLAVEVLSESNTAEEIEQKLHEYFQSGTRLAWIVDPVPRSVAIHHDAGKPTRVITETDMLDGEQVIPGFKLAVAELFAGVPIPKARHG
jgi:Uma2 family endonuclease